MCDNPLPPPGLLLTQALPLDTASSLFTTHSIFEYLLTHLPQRHRPGRTSSSPTGAIKHNARPAPVVTATTPRKSSGLFRVGASAGRRRRDDGERGRFTSRSRDRGATTATRNSEKVVPRTSRTSRSRSRSSNATTTPVTTTFATTTAAATYTSSARRRRPLRPSEAALLPPRLPPLTAANSPNASHGKEVVEITVLSEDEDESLASLDVSRFLVGGVPEGWDSGSQLHSAVEKSDVRQEERQSQGQIYRRPSAVSESGSEGEGEGEGSMTGIVAATLGRDEDSWTGSVRPESEKVRSSPRMKAQAPSPPPPPRRRVSSSSRIERSNLIPPLRWDHTTASLPPHPQSFAPRNHYRSFLPLQQRLLNHLESELAGLEILLIELDSEIEMEERRERELDELYRDSSRSRHRSRDYPDPHAYLRDLLHRHSGLLAHIEVTLKRYGELVDAVRKWAQMSAQSFPEGGENEHDIVDILAGIRSDIVSHNDRKLPQHLMPPTSSRGPRLMPFSLPLLTTFALTIALLPSVLWRLSMLLALAVWMLVVVPLIGPLQSWVVEVWNNVLVRLRRFDWFWARAQTWDPVLGSEKT